MHAIIYLVLSFYYRSRQITYFSLFRFRYLFEPLSCNLYVLSVLNLKYSALL